MKQDEFKGLLTPLEELAKLQHYSIPTRLVDVTINPLIALYFAVENTDDLSPGNVLLYLINGYPPYSKEAVCTPIIIQYSDMLQISNPWLYSQKGTFLICGNEVVNCNITNSLKSLDTLTPSVIIRIPYEYKKVQM